MFSKAYMDKLNALKERAQRNHEARSAEVPVIPHGLSHADAVRAAKARQEVAEMVRAQVAELSDKPKVDGLQARRDELAQKMKWASPQERDRLREKLKLYDERIRENEAIEQERQRQIAFSNDPKVKNVRTIAETLRSATHLYPAVDPVEIEKLKAIAASPDFQSVDHLHKVFFDALSIVEQTQYAADDAKTREALELTSKTFGELNLATETARQSRERLDAARKNLGADDAQQDSE